MSRNCGKSQLIAEMIKAYAYPSGLPRQTFVLMTGLKLIKWDKDTGEVSTIDRSEFK